MARIKIDLPENFLFLHQFLFVSLILIMAVMSAMILFYPLSMKQECSSSKIMAIQKWNLQE